MFSIELIYAFHILKELHNRSLLQPSELWVCKKDLFFNSSYIGPAILRYVLHSLLKNGYIVCRAGRYRLLVNPHTTSFYDLILVLHGHVGMGSDKTFHLKREIINQKSFLHFLDFEISVETSLKEKLHGVNISDVF